LHYFDGTLRIPALDTLKEEEPEDSSGSVIAGAGSASRSGNECAATHSAPALK